MEKKTQKQNLPIKPQQSKIQKYGLRKECDDPKAKEFIIKDKQQTQFSRSKTQLKKPPTSKIQQIIRPPTPKTQQTITPKQQIQEQPKIRSKSPSPQKIQPKQIIKKETKLLNNTQFYQDFLIPCEMCTQYLEPFEYDSHIQQHQLEQLMIRQAIMMQYEEIYNEQQQQLEEEENKGFMEYEIDRFCLIDFKDNKSLNDDNRRCSICLVDFIKNEKLRLLPCMHRYHPSCIDPWLLKDKSCAFCKQKLQDYI